MFLSLPDLEAFYGGSAGGGKSESLLMAALQFVHVPGYAAIIFRRTFADLNLPGGLIQRSMEWLMGKAKWSGANHSWTFPSGATLSFGYLENEQDKYRYQSSEFQYIGFDELTQLSEACYRYLFSRLRKADGLPVPLRVRSASNPGNKGHAWVKRRFISSHGLRFIPARLADNPHLDQAEYRKSLAQLDHVTRKQLEEGDWDISAGGLLFNRAWFEIVDAVPAVGRCVRYWDRAASEPSESYPDPDWTAGLKMMRDAKGVFYIVDVRRFRGRPATVETTIKTTASQDGPETTVWLEEDPGQAGKADIEHLVKALAGYGVRVARATADKETRARPASAQAEHGNIKLLRGKWNEDFLAEIESFPLGEHDDQVDALSGAVAALTNTRPILVA